MFAILTFTAGSEYLLACHEEATGGDMGVFPTLRGHNPKYRQSGILISFEGTTAFSSTSFSCDAYTSFLELSYDQIAENTAQGHGAYLDALTSFWGCPLESKDRFQQVIRKHFRKLFRSQKKDGVSLGYRLEIVLKRDRIIRNKCQTLS